MKTHKNHSILHFYRNHLMTPIAVVVILAITAVVGRYGYNSMCTRGLEAMEGSIRIARNNYQFISSTEQYKTSLTERVFNIRLNIFKNLLDGGSDIPESIKLLNELGTETVNVYYRYANGKTVGPEGCSLPELPEDDINTLSTDGRLLRDNSYYRFTEINGKDAFIAYWPVLSSNDNQLSEIVPEVCRQDMMIYDVSDDTLICKTGGFPCNSIEDINLLSMKTDYRLSEDGMNAYRYTLNGGNFLSSGIAVRYADEEGIVFLSVIENSYLLSRLIMWLFPFVLLLTAFYFLMLRACFRYREIWKGGILRSEYVIKIGKLRIDTKLLKPAMSLVVIGFTVMLATVCLVQILNVKTETNYRAKEKLQGVSSLYGYYHVYDDTLTRLFQNNAQRTTDFITDRLTDDNYDLSQDRLASLAEMADIARIDVYDKNGTIIASSSDYTGYSLSSIETDPEYSLWSVINGEAQHMTVISDAENGTYYSAVKRKDAVGMVRLTISNAAVSNFHDSLSLANALENSDSGSSDIICIDRSDDSRYFWYRGASHTVTSHINDFDESLINDEYASSITLDGSIYSTYTLVTDELILICLDEPASYLSSLIYSTVAFGGGCLLLIILLLLGTVVYADETLESAPPIDENAVLQGFQQKMILRFISTTLAVTCIYYVIDWFAGYYPVIPFLLARHWSYGLNFYSIICAISDVVIAFVLCFIYSFFFGQLKKWLGPRSKTIVRLLYSVVCVITVAVSLVFALCQIGIDMTTILGGLGLTGLALSLGAQSTLADLIAGISMILDRHIQIGDFVEVSGFKGVVIDINIRTTKIKFGSTVRSVQNSSMTNVSCKAAVNGVINISAKFVVPYSVPKDEVVSAIINGADEYEKAEPGLLKGGITYLNICAFEPYGVCYIIRSSAEPLRYNRALHTMLSVTKQLLDENGIPFAESKIYVSE